MKNTYIASHETNFNRSISELDAAQTYLFRVNRAPLIVLGRSEYDADLLKRIKMPLLPKLMNNKRERNKLNKPWFFVRLLLGATSKSIAIKRLVARAIKQEKQKQMIANEFVLEKALQDPMPHEHVEHNPITFEEFKLLCSNS